MEAGYYYKWQTQSASYDYSSTYPISEEGQKAFTDDLISMLNNHANVNGLYWWWMEANEYGKPNNVTTNWYCASLWNNETGYPTPAFFSLKAFADNDLGIYGMPVPSMPTDSRYDLMGRKASDGARGIIIVDGKKKVVK